MAVSPDEEPPPHVLRVTRANATAGWSALATALAAAACVPGAYVAIDTEFTGLGTTDSAAARSDELDVRYAWLLALAATRAVTSLGVAVFVPHVPDEGGGTDPDAGGDDGKAAPASGAAAPVSSGIKAGPGESVGVGTGAPAGEAAVASASTNRTATPAAAVDGTPPAAAPAVPLPTVAGVSATAAASAPVITGCAHSPTPRNKSRSPRRYTVTAFDFLLLCERDFVVTPSAGTFLAHHAFDWNAMFLDGIPYERAASVPVKAGSAAAKTAAAAAAVPAKGAKAAGSAADAAAGSHGLSRSQQKKRRRAANNAELLSLAASPVGAAPPAAAASLAAAGANGREAAEWEWSPWPGGLLHRLSRAPGLPLVVHNGLADLALLYGAFHGPLPPTVAGFCAALGVVTAGVYDTKVVAESVGGQRLSSLGYLYAKCGRLCGRGGGGKLLAPRPADAAASADVSATAGPPVGSPRGSKSGCSPPTPSRVLCEQFAARGFCSIAGCRLLHDIAAVLDREEADAAAAAAGEKAPDRRQAAGEQRRVAAAAAAAAAAAEATLADTATAAASAAGAGGGQKRPRDTEVGDTSTAKGAAPPAVAAPGRAASTSAAHAAGYDAYMTGYVFGALRRMVGGGVGTCVDKVNVVRRAAPLLVGRSKYGAT
ncbi:hypothetical protein MMPV_002442 [Pyropia vietnamensis]